MKVDVGGATSTAFATKAAKLPLKGCKVRLLTRFTKHFKYGKPWLGEYKLTQIGLDTPSLAQITLSVLPFLSVAAFQPTYIKQLQEVQK